MANRPLAGSRADDTFNIDFKLGLCEVVSKDMIYNRSKLDVT